MGADNHATVVPKSKDATAKNPFRDYDYKELMREFARYDARKARGALTGVNDRAKYFAAAHELRRRDISAAAAREEFAYPRE